MPSDPDSLNVRLVRNDGNYEFKLKCQNMDINISNNVVAQGIISAAGDLVGKNISIGFENYTCQGMIQETDPSTYPNLQNVDTNQWKEATAKEMALAEAARLWGPDLSGGLDTLYWGPREITGLISKYSAGEDVDQYGQEKYDYTLEFSHLDFTVEDE